jgi:hypothetical protein
MRIPHLFGVEPFLDMLSPFGKRAHINGLSEKPHIASRDNSGETIKGTSMQNLLHRHVDAAESTRLGIESGWYGTKVSGTFVTGPHASEADCLRKIAELNTAITKGKA